MALPKQIFNLYNFIYNLSKVFFQEQNIDFKNFTFRKNSIGELQVLDALNKSGDFFFSTFTMKYHNEKGINIQGSMNRTYFLLQIKFTVSKFYKAGDILSFLKNTETYKNVVKIFFCPSGVSESCKKVSNKIKFIMSLDGLLTVIKKPSMISHEKMRPVFERPSWKFQNFEACNSMLSILNCGKLTTYPVRFMYSFSFDLINEVNLTGYVGFDYIGTYLLHEEIYYVAYSDNRKAPRGVLEEKYREFISTMNAYFQIIILAYS
ncbi:hypothetical protein C2G38_2213192 [Gigaspora rosea]|uniref:Uncharacterized protein n=1 Tax=Gigaspora rosea TaxID=44941 RepID=A0A397UE01_9GLOM|nr:hypothetical protein C2G38_2213192 [Gigaspora rosea]